MRVPSLPVPNLLRTHPANQIGTVTSMSQRLVHRFVWSIDTSLSKPQTCYAAAWVDNHRGTTAWLADCMNV